MSSIFWAMSTASSSRRHEEALAAVSQNGVMVSGNTLTFDDQATSFTFDLPIVDDREQESTETFSVGTVSSPRIEIGSGFVSLGTVIEEIDILDNDATIESQIIDNDELGF
ncbi:MAG: hypothetical protein R3C02_18740 [Planctomycetaceae bacterium]